MKNRFLLLISILSLVDVCFSQSTVYNQGNHRIREEWLDLGLQSIPKAIRKKGIHRFDSLYLLHYNDSLGANFNASPLFAVWMGKEQGLSERRYQNSRGMLFTANYKSFSCYAMIMENQSVFPVYQQDFVKHHGEFYPGSNSYNQQNGMVPGAGRTKPFKAQGFDYAYSQGGMQWKIHQRFSVYGGNAPLRFGDGMRSLFWSTHNQVPLIGGILQITPKLRYYIAKGRLFDLIRKPVYANVESPYYKKGYSMNALLFSGNHFQLGAVYQTIWEGGDSLQERPFSPLFWIPLPGFDRLANQRVSFPQWGVIGSIEPVNNLRLYGEAFCRGLNSHATSYQIGAKYCITFHNRFFMSFNASFTSVGNTFYGETYGLSFSSNNMPLGSLIGNGTKEVLLLGKLAYKRFYIDFTLQNYASESGKSILFRDTYTLEHQVIHGIGEFGFVLNPISQCVIFVSLDYRKGSSSTPTRFLFAGMKTSLFPNQHVY
ncbi:MAG: hypothetical protein EBR54_00710 [Flavobacteriia bacterium]|nr:hypothetical protein [Flavobacteriia bacterium]